MTSGKSFTGLIPNTRPGSRWFGNCDVFSLLPGSGLRSKKASNNPKFITNQNEIQRLYGSRRIRRGVEYPLRACDRARDGITFQGDSVAEVIQAFHDSVDDYLEFCAKRGESPEKPYSGHFVLRIDPQLHRVMSHAAEEQGASLNSLIEDRLKESFGLAGSGGVTFEKAPRKRWSRSEDRTLPLLDRRRR